MYNAQSPPTPSCLISHTSHLSHLRYTNPLLHPWVDHLFGRRGTQFSIPLLASPRHHRLRFEVVCSILLSPVGRPSSCSVILWVTDILTNHMFRSGASFPSTRRRAQPDCCLVQPCTHIHTLFSFPSFDLTRASCILPQLHSRSFR